jgi:hypothetical protein
MLNNHTIIAKNIKAVFPQVQNWVADPLKFNKANLPKIDTSVLTGFDDAETTIFLEVVNDAMLKIIESPARLRSFHIFIIIGLERHKDKLDTTL